ncbi:MAG: YIP1 family protein [Acidobacteriota bacterium]
MAEQNIHVEDQPPAGWDSSPGSWWRLYGIFLEPTRTFQEINRRPNWAPPLLLVVLIAALTNVYIINSIGFKTILRQQMQQNSQFQELTREQQEEQIERVSEQALVRYLSYLGPIFSVIVVLLVAGVLLLGLVLGGSESTFRKVFSVTCHSFFFYTALVSVLSVLVVMLTEDKEGIQVQNIVQSNLGLLVERTESSVLYTVASSVDVFSFYLIYLLSLGLSVVGKRISFGKAVGTVGSFWLLWVLAKTGWSALFS